MKEFFRKGYVDAFNAAVYAVIYAFDVHSHGFPGDVRYLLVALIGVRCFQLASDLSAVKDAVDDAYKVAVKVRDASDAPSL